MNKLVKDALVLTCITVIAGFALGLVYEITKAPIAKAIEVPEEKVPEVEVPEKKEKTTKTAAKKPAAKKK